MRTGRTTFLALLLFLTALLPEGHAESLEEDRAFFETVLSAASRVDRISSDFVQERRFSMLQKTVAVKGRLFYEKPDRLRWEQIEPNPGGFVVNGRKIRRWQGPEGRAETTDLAREPAFAVFANQLFAWCKGDFDWLQKRYEIKIMNRLPPILRLTPLVKEEKRHISHLTITFAEEGGYVAAVEVATKDRDTILTTFRETVINGPLPKDLF